jgi:hypothetical protein
MTTTQLTVTFWSRTSSTPMAWLTVNVLLTA